MTHEEAVLRVPDLGRGRLAPKEEASLKAHVDGCAECSGLAKAYGLVRATLRTRSEHPDPAELVAHAMGTAPRADVGDHLGSCSSCSGQAAAIRSAEAELAAKRIPLRTWGMWAAAAAIPLLVGYAAWMQLSVLPGLRERSAGGAASSETVALPLLAPSTRGEDGSVVVPIGARQRTVALAVAPVLTSDLDDSELLQIEVRGHAGAVLYSREITAGEVRRLSGESGAFALVLPASVLPSGEATLHIRANSAGELLAAPFQVRRE